MRGETMEAKASVQDVISDIALGYTRDNTCPVEAYMPEAARDKACLGNPDIACDKCHRYAADKLAGEILDKLRPHLVEDTGRLMPAGMEWPRFEDGEPVKLGDEFENSKGNASVLRRIMIKDTGKEFGGEIVWSLNRGDTAVEILQGGRIKRPAPKVLDADGVEIHVGDTVYFTDGREQECNTVVHAKYDYKDEPYVQLGRLNDVGYPTYTNCSCIDPSHLTHTKPEQPDSWERLEADAKAWVNPTREERADLVRRAKKLAERGQ